MKAKKFLKYFLFFFGIGTAVGILNTSIVVTTYLTEGEKFSLFRPAVWEFTGSYSFALLLPLALFIFRKYPVSKNNFAKPVFIYFLTSLAIGLLHVFFMYYSRQFIYNLAGWGAYNYGDLTFRILMEYIKICTGLLTAFLIYNLFRHTKEREAEKARRARLEEQLTRTRLLALKSQLNPHFLFNTLNMISSAMYEDVNTADKMIANLSAMLRTTLYSSDKTDYTLKEELDFLNLYIEIMKSRFNDKLEINFSIDESSRKGLVPHFLLQPLVENSIKYGMENLSGVTIDIETTKNNGRLILNIKDNGPGINYSRSEVLSKGVGISNTIERLEKTFNDDFTFSWNNLESGVVFTINIPFRAGDN